MPITVEDFIQINIPKGKIVTVSFDAYEHQEFEILDPQKLVVCNTNSNSHTPFLFKNQSFSTEISGNYTIVVKSNKKEEVLILTEVNEIFEGFKTTKFYTFVSSQNAEITLVVS